MMRTTMTLRTRIVAAMVVVACIALVFSGVLITVVQRVDLQVEADADLIADRDRFLALVRKNTDPSDGSSFSGPMDLIQTWLEHQGSGTDEGAVGFSGTELMTVTTDPGRLRPADDPGLLNELADLVVGDEIVITTMHTELRKYRVLVVPVRQGDQRATLVQVIDLDARAARLHSVTLVCLAAAGIAVMVATGLAWIGVDRLLRPIEELQAAAEEINEKDLTSRVPVHGRDDLGRLANGFNRMLDRVQHAVQGQRDLMDDVGHELRTPMTVVRGHLELMDPTDPEDTMMVRDIAIDELDRMEVLIGDLLLLARSVDSDFVKIEPCSVTDLTVSVLGKAEVIGDRRWRLDQVADGVACLDAVRVTQAWLQLASNAVKYSEPGSVIAIGSAICEQTVRMWVTDEGTGIGVEDLARIRERSVRARHVVGYVPGSGLGLSIVESIVRAHGGVLEIESVLGKGSTFTLCLPAWDATGERREVGG
ncbi:hypothetical protein HMPREF1531_00448 [Propionibacterium sp. oral taxon 192 str. F0372]|nr:hypothetical protein HMPREF1531_00448 [Propionibacterium sp. oral taxon 192 str. F0372]